VPRYEDRGGGRFWEIEQDENVLRIAHGRIDGDAAPKRSETTHPDEDHAYYEMGNQIRGKHRRGYRWVGPSRVLATTDEAAGAAGSALLLDELFAVGDDGFGVELLRTTAAARLGAFAERWYRDKRPWARRALLAYIDDGCGRPHHKQLVKKLFKAAEAAADDEALAHFMVAFDRLTHRVLVERYAYDPATRNYVSGLALREDPTVIERVRPPRVKKPGKDVALPTFSRATRRYLARRAARYVRRLGYQDLARYRRTVGIALPLYPDGALAGAARLLDAWGLTQTLYGLSPVLERRPAGIRLAAGRGLDELTPAPRFPAAWPAASAETFDELWRFVLSAHSRTVRAWSIAMLRRDHRAALDALAIDKVAALLHSPHTEVSSLGAELLPKVRGLETVPIARWLELLAIEDLDVIPLIVAVVERVVAPSRLDLAQCARLAVAPIAAVATLGVRWAREKPIRTADDLAHVARMTRGAVAPARAEAAAWAVELARTHAAAGSAFLRDLSDAPYADVRAPALATLAATERFAAEPALWFALTESPYDDVRAFVLQHAQRWRDAAEPATLRHVWTSAVLAVHRGSTVKRRVPRAIAERVVAHPEEADALLPVLGLALRSVRAPERAAALAALARAVVRDPSLRERARAHLPELTVSGEVTS
jgi:predicted DNA-binding WGR domain protein